MPEATVFTSRNQFLILRNDRYMVQFRNGEFRTSDPGEIEFLMGVAHDDRDGGVRVKEAPVLLLAPAEQRESPKRRRVTVSEPSPVLATFVKTLSQRLRPEEIEQFGSLENRLVGSLRPDAEEFRRARQLAENAVTGGLLPALRVADFVVIADQVQRVASIGDPTVGQMALAVLRHAASHGDDNWAAAALEAVARLAESTVRLVDWARVAGEFGAHANWAAVDAHTADELVATARGLSVESEEEAKHLEVEASTALADIPPLAQETARARLAATLASAVDAERLELAWEEAERRQSEAEKRARELADAAVRALASATIASQRAFAADGAAAAAGDAHSSAARCFRAAAVAAIDLAELVAVRAAETIAIAAETPARSEILEQVLLLVETLAIAGGSRA